jgi:hypothetical protein
VAAIHRDGVRCGVSGATTGNRRSGAPLASDTATSGTHRLRFASICVCIAALVVFARWPAADAAQPDYRVPWLRGIRAITVSDNVVVDGSGMGSSSPCQLDRIGLEHHSVETLFKGGLDAIGAVDRMAKLRALQSEFDKALHDLTNAPPNARPRWDYEQSERRRREGDSLTSQPLLFVHVAVATLDGGECAAGITTELRAFARERPVINYNGEQVFADLNIWEAAPLALAVPSAGLEHAVTERLDTQISEFITASQTANGQ